jgi:hypothetical protein
MKFFLPTIWYTSDMFFWFLYAGSFLLKRTNSFEESNPSSIDLLHSNRYLDDYFMIFEKISQNLDHYLKLKLGLNISSLSNVFRTIALLCILGACGKFYLNLQSCVSVLYELVIIDGKLAQTK